MFFVLLASAILQVADAAQPGASVSERAPYTMKDQSELIVVAAPRHDDPYYAEEKQNIFDFHIAYAAVIAGHDDFLVLTDAETYPAYVQVLGEARVAIAPQSDIWLRDFGLSNMTAPVMFRYTAEGQGGKAKGQADADDVQDIIAELTEVTGLTYKESDLLNDGGNFVDDYHGRAVLSRKFLRDNNLEESEARGILIEATGLSHIAFIEADEQGGLEHADGVVAFIDPNVLVINTYPEDPEYAADLRAQLRADLPDVVIHEIVTPHDDSKVVDDRFGSACGLYTNMLVTPDRIYFPQFDIPEDQEALESIRRWTSKEVIPVPSGKVCHMGGSVRCMSWQLRGENAAKLKAWAASTDR
ncbi:MAG: agmatine deiminase family protein [Aquisalinus sp.]|nr:agmatine deiminase family protein [Aquisalinus sp.]